MRPLLLVGAFAWVPFVACYTGSTAPPESGAALSFESRQDSNISALYNQYCQNCHGDRGQGGGGGTRTLLTEDLFAQDKDRRFFDAIKDGVPDAGMEPFGKTLSQEAIWALVVHIRELQARALAKPATAMDEVVSSKHATYRVETVLDSDQLDVPWAIDWLPDGRMLVTNRSGSVLIVSDGQIVGSVEGLPQVVNRGQGGLMDVAVHPDYKKSGWIYLSYSSPNPAGGSGAFTHVVRGKLEGRKWTNQQTIWQPPADSYNTSGIHFGCKIVFDKKGHVFFSTGERGSGELAQQLGRPNGKIHRVNEDGSIPSDNPFLDDDNVKSVWSYGHRNPQGLVMTEDGTLFDTEHGPRGGDELNVIKKAANYGWPLVCFGINYNDSAFRTPWPDASANITLPVYRWLPSIGASGLDMVRGSAFPGWNGDLVAGGLSGTNVDRLRVKNGKLLEIERIFFGRGRVREVVCSPKGEIVIALNGPDRIVKLVPAK